MATTNHFRVLDGLRGVAAISVVMYHFGGRSDLPQLMPRGYLAVDFFFVLSGLVLAHAYLQRLKQSLTAMQFVIQRLIRLWPMLLPGTILGAAMEFWRPNAGDFAHRFVEVSIVAILGCLAIPWPLHTSMEQTIFPINGPVWSLFFEILANFVFIAVAKSTFTRSATLLLAAGGLATLVGLSLSAGAIDMGPLVDSWPGGLPRVLFSFFVGVMLCEYRSRLAAIAVWIYPIVLLAVFMTPVLSGPLNAVIDLVAVTAMFPLIVGSASNCAPGRMAHACALSGDLSYPVYAIHYPIIRAIGFILLRRPLPIGARLGAGFGAIILVCLLSWAALRFYDQPIRGFLARRFIPARVPKLLPERSFANANLGEHSTAISQALSESQT